MSSLVDKCKSSPFKNVCALCYIVNKILAYVILKVFNFSFYFNISGIRVVIILATTVCIFIYIYTYTQSLDTEDWCYDCLKFNYGSIGINYCEIYYKLLRIT